MQREGSADAAFSCWTRTTELLLAAHSERDAAVHALCTLRSETEAALARFGAEREQLHRRFWAREAAHLKRVTLLEEREHAAVLAATAACEREAAVAALNDKAERLERALRESEHARAALVSAAAAERTAVAEATARGEREQSLAKARGVASRASVEQRLLVQQASPNDALLKQLFAVLGASDEEVLQFAGEGAADAVSAVCSRLRLEREAAEARVKEARAPAGTSRLVCFTDFFPGGGGFFRHKLWHKRCKRARWQPSGRLRANAARPT